MKKALLIVLSLLLSVAVIGCGSDEVTEVKGEKPETTKKEQEEAEKKLEELLKNPTFKDVKQEEDGPLVDVYELSTEAKHARHVAYGSEYYDRANWDDTKNNVDFALLSVVISDRQPRIDPDTYEITEGKAGAISLNLAIRNRAKKTYDAGMIRLITSNGQQFDNPLLWNDSDPSKNEVFPSSNVSPGAVARWDLTYQVDPKQVKNIEWIQLVFEVWSEDGEENFKVDSGKIPLGEPTKFEKK